MVIKDFIRHSKRKKELRQNNYLNKITHINTSSQQNTDTLINQLEQIQGQDIDAYFVEVNLPKLNRDMELDAIVLCSGLGIVAIKTLSACGRLRCSSEQFWEVDDNGSISYIPNTSLEVQTAAAMLQHRMNIHGLRRWPIIPLVVNLNNEARLEQQGNMPLQSDVIHLANLGTWFNVNTDSDNRIVFTKDDFNYLSQFIDFTSQEFRTAI